MITDDQELMRNILDCVELVPGVPPLDAFESIRELCIVSRDSLFVSGQLFLGTSLLVGSANTVMTAFPRSFPQPHSHSLPVIATLLLTVIYELRNQISSMGRILHKVRANEY